MNEQKEKPVDAKRTTLAKYSDIYNAVADAWKKEDQVTSALREASKTEPDYMKGSNREHFSYHMARQIAFNQILNAMKPLLDELRKEELDKISKEQLKNEKAKKDA